MDLNVQHGAVSSFHETINTKKEGQRLTELDRSVIFVRSFYRGKKRPDNLVSYLGNVSFLYRSGPHAIAIKKLLSCQVLLAISPGKKD